MENKTNYPRPFPDEWPLSEDVKHLCKTARFVGGMSRYLCECKKPENCAGVQQMQINHEKTGEKQ